MRCPFRVVEGATGGSAGASYLICPFTFSVQIFGRFIGGWYMRTSTMVMVLVAGMAMPVAAQEGLRPLEEVLQQENSPHIAVYVLKRCAAVYGASFQRLKGSNRADVQAMLPGFENTSAAFMFAAVSGAKENKLNETSDSIIKDIVTLTGLYGKMMDDAYLRTGNATDGQFATEMQVCKALKGNN